MVERNDSNNAKENLYVALGLLAKKFPDFVKDKIHIVQLYFDALDTEEPHVKISVMQGLGSLIIAYQNPTPAMQKQLEDFFLEIIQNVQNVSVVVIC